MATPIRLCTEVSSEKESSAAFGTLPRSCVLVASIRVSQYVRLVKVSD
jgi:hypothetical protein